VLTAATILLARHWMRRLEQRALAAYPDPDREDTNQRVPALRGDD